MKRLSRYAAVALVLSALLMPVGASAWGNGNGTWWRADYFDGPDLSNRIGAEGQYCHGSYYSWGDTDWNPYMTYDEGSCEIGPLE